MDGPEIRSRWQEIARRASHRHREYANSRNMATTLHLLTGILGSGKTSVLRHLLDAPLPNARVGVVVGEFADEGFDGELLQETSAQIREVSGGVVRVGASPYVEAVRSFLWEGNCSVLFVETSGVADIGQIAGALLSDELVAREAVLGPSITVLDGGAFRAHDTHFHDQLWAQIAAADVVLINKTDKISDMGLEEIRERVLERQPRARVLFCYMGQVRRREVFGPVEEGFRSALVGVAGRTDTAPAEFESFVYESELICFDRIAFGHLLLNLPGERIARFKGCVRSYDGTHGLNGLPGQLDWVNEPAKGPTRIAFIGLELERRRETITALLDEALASQQEETR